MAIAEFEAKKMNTGVRLPKAAAAAALAGTLIVAALVTGATVLAAGPAPVGLGTAAPFAVLAGTPAITNTGATTIVGDVGIAPALAVTGFPPGTVSGAVHKGDAVAIQAKSDLTTAYTDAAGRPATATHATLGGLTLVGGVYTAGGATLGLTGTLTLDGQNDPNSVWIFQATSDLVTASSSAVELINGASACNVYWQVTSSATLGSGSTFVGTILALTSITMAAGVAVDGRALARNGEVTLINDSISNADCSAASATAAPSVPTAPSATPSVAPGSTTSSAKPTVPPTDTDASPGAGTSGATTIVLFVGLLALALVVFPARRRLERYRIR